MIIPPPPSAPEPPAADLNKRADYWFNVIGVNVFPADTRKKRTFIKWSQWQNRPLEKWQFEEWKQTGAFKDGLAIIPGEVWRGEHKGNHLIFIDLDNKKAIQEICTRNGKTVTLQEIAEKFIVEMHRDDPNKVHIFFYSEIPFEKKSSDIIATTPTLDQKTAPENIPAFEVKGKGTHGIAYVTPSVHKNGHPYEIIGTETPILLNPSAAHGMMDHLDAICRKYNFKYLKDSSSSIGVYDNDITTTTDAETTAYTDSASELFKDGVVIYPGHNRHLACLRAMDRILRVFHEDHSEDEIKAMAWDWNLKHCPEGPLDEREFEKLWKQAKEFIARKNREQTKQQTVDTSNGNGKTGTASTTNIGAGSGGEGSNNDDGRSSKAKKALELAMAEADELFLDEFGRAFAAMRMLDGHVEIHSMDENKFKNWISGLFYDTYDQLLGDDDLNKIIRILTSRAEHDPSIKRYKLDVRVRGYNSKKQDQEEQDDEDAVGNVGDVGIFSELTEDFDSIYYDLTNKKWEAIKITAEGWTIDKEPPRLFRRYSGELPQVYPDRNYHPTVLSEYVSLLNLKPENKDTQELPTKVKLVTDLWPNTTPKPIIIIPSAQGTGKTTSFELNKDLIDPNAALTMSFPKDDNQLKQALAHNYISYFDNLSYISDEQSNTLCRAITGAGDFKRALYENDADVIYNYRRIIGLNGITNVATRPDLMERGLIILLGDIPKNQRELLRIIRRKYLMLKPKVLAFLLDVVSEIMAERKKWKGIDEDYFGLKDVIDKNGGLPRMADWAILGEQAAAIIARKEGRPYEQGTFLKAFDENLKILNIEAIKASLVAEALIAFMTNRKAEGKGTTWEGSPTILLAELNTFIVYNRESIRINTDSKAWPQNPSLLGKEIAQIAPNLRALGITIEVERTETNVLYKIAIETTSVMEGGGR